MSVWFLLLTLTFIWTLDVCSCFFHFDLFPDRVAKCIYHLFKTMGERKPYVDNHFSALPTNYILSVSKFNG